MSRIEAFIDSGILQLYVLGIATPEEEREVELMASAYMEVREALEAFSDEMERLAMENAIEPPGTLKTLIFNHINELETSSTDNEGVIIPTLHRNSSINEYSYWINRPDMALPEEANNIHVSIIGHNKQMTTAIVWVKDEFPEEIHEKEIENFMIIEGSCRLFIEDKTYHLTAGDFFTVPLHKKHSAIVTSIIPCKVLLQRIAM